MLYLQPFSVAFLVAASLSAFLIWLFSRFGLGAGRCRSSSLAKAVDFRRCSRLGGVAMGAAFVATLLGDPDLVLSRPLWGLILGSALAFVAGAWDDFCDLSWKMQLFLQASIATLVVSLGARITHITDPLGGVFSFVGPFWAAAAFLLSVIWIMAVMNAINWIDGIDGLSGGIALIAAISLALLSLKSEVNQPPIAIVSVALAGAIGGFWLFNLYPAKIFAGTGGSMLMGLALAVISIIAGMKIATTLVVMALPVLDAARVLYLRIKDGAHPAQADERHLHYRLASRKWSVWRICLFIWTVTLLISFLALNTRALGKVAVFSGVALIWMLISYLARPKTDFSAQEKI